MYYLMGVGVRTRYFDWHICLLGIEAEGINSRPSRNTTRLDFFGVPEHCNIIYNAYHYYYR
jgi:hypothetical protein